MYLVASFRVWILLSLSDGRVGMMRLSCEKASFSDWVLWRSRTFANTRWFCRPPRFWKPAQIDGRSEVGCFVRLQDFGAQDEVCIDWGYCRFLFPVHPPTSSPPSSSSKSKFMSSVAIFWRREPSLTEEEEEEEERGERDGISFMGVESELMKFGSGRWGFEGRWGWVGRGVGSEEVVGSSSIWKADSESDFFFLSLYS